MKSATLKKMIRVGAIGVFALTLASGPAFAGGMNRETTRTGPGGHSATTSHSQSWGVQNGQMQRTSEHTGPGGQSVSSTKTVTPTESGMQRSRTMTGPGGYSSSKTTTVNRSQ